jgi:hypothetical protein
MKLSLHFGRYSFSTGTIACVKTARRTAEKNIHHRGTESTEGFLVSHGFR